MKAEYPIGEDATMKVDSDLDDPVMLEFKESFTRLTDIETLSVITWMQCHGETLKRDILERRKKVRDTFFKPRHSNE
jgi:hypothetical protein